MFRKKIQDIEQMLKKQGKELKEQRQELEEQRQELDNHEQGIRELQMSYFQLYRGNIVKKFVDKLLGSPQEGKEDGDQSKSSHSAAAIRTARAASNVYQQRSTLLERFPDLDEACFKPLQQYEKVTFRYKDARVKVITYVHSSNFRLSMRETVLHTRLTANRQTFVIPVIPDSI